MLTKVRHVVLPRGVPCTVDWPMRYPNGTGMDLSDCFPSEESLSAEGGVEQIPMFRFAVCDKLDDYCEGEGSVAEASTGRLRFNVPEAVYNTSGIYRLNVAVVDSVSGVVKAMDSGLVSVEGTLWGDVASGNNTPPTLADIRMHLRDTPIENELLSDFEFDSDEIINAMVRPIRQWNETPPPIGNYTTQTFPFRFHWLNATVGELLMTATHHYMRNNLKVQHGGVSGNIKDKAPEYLAMAERYKQEWRNFIQTKKVELNAQNAVNSINLYTQYYW